MVKSETMLCGGFGISEITYEIAEITCPTKYFPEASSIYFRRSAKYGLGVLCTALQYRMQKWHLGRFDIFS